MSRNLADLNIAVVSGTDRYPALAPFHPPELYPEHPHREITIDSTNLVYPMVRDAFHLLRLDDANFGLPTWNPLGELISPGQRVLIKPNFVLHFNAGAGPLEAVVTHPSVIRAICDYALIALKGEGEIIVGDAPQMNCDFEKLCEATGMAGLASYLSEACARRGIAFKLIDFRQEQTFYKHGIVWERKPLGNGKARPVRVSLGKHSFMDAIDITRLYGADYSRSETVRAHQGDHQYLIAPAVLSSDVVISVPKLKVHRKVGVTLNLKNMVGINADKNHLAHYRIGSPASGGDEFSNPKWIDRAERALSDLLLGNNWQAGKYPFLAWRAFRKVWRNLQGASGGPAFTHGDWHGNDTAWRMVLDLNRILLFADREGVLQHEPVRRYFSVIDGVIGGEGEGPLHPDAFRSGVVMAGFNPLAVDWVGARLMGFDPMLIPLYVNGLEQMREWLADFALSQISIRSNAEKWKVRLENQEAIYSFRPSAGWRGKIEMAEKAKA